MSTNLLLAIYIVIAALGIFAAIMGIINWIMFNSISTSVNEINDELEKRGREFDSLKGASIRSQNSSNTNATQQTQISPEQHDAIDEQNNVEQSNRSHESFNQQNIEDSQTPQIDIVRNVRGEFEHPAAGVMKKETVIMKIDDIENALNKQDTSNEPEESATKNQIANTESPATEPEEELSSSEIEISGDTIIDNPKENSDAFVDFSLKRSNLNKTNINDEVMDVISEPENPNKIGNDKSQGISIPLFSKAQNDADFKAMWIEIQKILEDAVVPVHINIDFSNIIFLYKEEIDYLKNIQINIRNKNCTLGFINCSPELVKIIWEDNDLGNLIMDI